MFLTTATTPFALSCEMSYPLTYDSACKALGLSNEADLLTVALGIADKHPFGFTIGDMRSHAAPYNARMSGPDYAFGNACNTDRKSTRLNSSHSQQSRMPSSA